MSGALHPGPATPAAAHPAAARLIGIDLARLVAVAGMMAAHTLGSEATVPPAIVALIDGPPSTLFAVLGGVSVTLAGRARLEAGDRGGAMRSTVARGVVVALLGVLIAPLAFTVYVVLVPFGVAIALAAPLLLARSWLLAALATAIMVAGGSVVTWASMHLLSLHHATTELGPLESVLAATNDVLLTGVYPALTWLGYLIIGMLVARWLLSARARGAERATLTRLAGLGALLTGIGVAMSELGVLLLSDVVAPGQPSIARDWLLENGYGSAPDDGPLWQLLAAPHTGTPADMARTAGIALLAIGLLGLLVRRMAPRTLRALEPLRAAGGAPLTIYIVHVVGYSLAAGLLIEAVPWLVSGWTGWAAQVAIALAIGAMLAASGSRGPFERLVGRAATLAARRRG